MPERVAVDLFTYISAKSTFALPARRQVAQAIVEIESVLNAPERDGGVTYSLYFGDQWGQPFYAVGLDNNLTRTTRPEQRTEALSAFLQAHQELLTHPRCCIGVWQTTDADGVETAWVDVAVLVYNEIRAHEFAQMGNQIAFYDLRRGGVGEISIGGTGEYTLERLNRLDAQDIVIESQS